MLGRHPLNGEPTREKFGDWIKSEKKERDKCKCEESVVCKRDKSRDKEKNKLTEV